MALEQTVRAMLNENTTKDGNLNFQDALRDIEKSSLSLTEKTSAYRMAAQQELRDKGGNMFSQAAEDTLARAVLAQSGLIEKLDNVIGGAIEKGQDACFSDRHTCDAMKK